MGSLKKKEKWEIGIGWLFFRYFFMVFFVDLIIIGITAITVLYAFSYNVILPGNYTEHAVEDIVPTLSQVDVITEGLLPDTSEFAVFDTDGKFLYGNMTEEFLPAAWNSVKYPRYSYRAHYFTVVQRDNEYCVITYVLEPQFRDAKMREKIKHPQTIVINVVIGSLILTALIAAIRFGVVIKKRIKEILSITEKIENQDLDFEIKLTNLKEINSVLRALDHMKQALNESLTSQWEKEELRKKQISGLAHDLKTPITIVKGNTELLLDLEPTEDQKECLTYIEESTDRMSEYIKALIELNNADQPITPVFEDIDMAVFQDCVDSVLKGICSAKELSYSLTDTSKIKSFRGDRQLLLRAIENMISNASDYTGKGTKISVTVSKEENNLVFSVEDEGTGFSEEGLKYADTLFFMGDSSRNRKGHYGIGLYEVGNIAKLHTGELRIGNREEGGAFVRMSIGLENNQ